MCRQNNAKNGSNLIEFSSTAIVSVNELHSAFSLLFTGQSKREAVGKLAFVITIKEKFLKMSLLKSKLCKKMIFNFQFASASFFN